MSEQPATPAISVKAKITVKHPTGTQTIECPTPEALAHEAIHCLVQALGTAGARQLVEKKLSTYVQDYPGLAVAQ